MLLAFASNDTTKIIAIVVAVGAFIGLLALLAHSAITARRNKKNGTQQPADTNAENAGNDIAVHEDNPDAAVANEIVMSRNVIYSAGADGQLRAGKYALKNADESSNKFNVRFNGLVKEYSNGDVVTLSDGDTLSPVSGSIVVSIVEG